MPFHLTTFPKIITTNFTPSKTSFYISFKNGFLRLDEYTKVIKLEKIPNKDKKFDWVSDICNMFNEITQKPELTTEFTKVVFSI